MDEIESLIGGPLPAHARHTEAWWTASRRWWPLGHANAWLHAGYKVSLVSIDRGWVRFRKRIAYPVRQTRMLVIVATVAAISLLVILVLWLIPSFLVRHLGLAGAALATAENSTRTTLIALLIALGATATLVFTARTYGLSRESHVTERITNAVEQLGHPSIGVRLGGIYGLSRIAEDSPRDAPAVVSILCQYVLSESRVTRRPKRAFRSSLHHLRLRHAQGSVDPASGIFAMHIRADLRVAVSEAALLSIKLPPLSLQLTGVQLDGAYLSRIVAREAALDGCCLRRAYLDGADFRQSWLRYAQLQDSWFRESLLQGVDFSYSRLRNADFSGANLEGARFFHADLTGVNFEGARLAGADLRNAKGLTRQQLDKAILDHSTRLTGLSGRPSGSTELGE
jgi:uncharacterized protein YjbI with pentapeptide repeats